VFRIPPFVGGTNEIRRPNEIPAAGPAAASSVAGHSEQDHAVAPLWWLLIRHAVSSGGIIGGVGKLLDFVDVNVDICSI